ncbi:MAG: outer membrane beta-barrel protein [Saprospiraceae bacterium]|nr:outer membrane beta-barrel protein [Saprospiraceae bacterium]
MKNTFLLFALLLVTLRLNAQFVIGVGGGVNVSSARLVGWEIFPGFETEEEAITAFHFSVQPRYVFARRWAAILDLQYNRKGAELNIFGLRADYFDMMPQVEYRFLEHFGVAAGANFGFKIREERKDLINDEWRESVFENFKDQDFGLLFALRGYFGGFYGTVSYNLGLKDVSDVWLTDQDGNTIQTEWYHRNLQIGLGYLIPLRKR